MESGACVVYGGETPDGLERIRQALEADPPGFRARFAASWPECLDLVRQDGVTCFVVDFSWTGGHAESVLREIRALNAVMPVLFLLACEDEAHVCDLMASGASGYVLKTPRYPERLPGAIHAACERQRLHALERWAEREQCQIEDIVQKARAEVDAANRVKHEFLANISHEIRTPMNAILGFADLLCEHETDSEKRQHLQIIQEAGRQLLRSIDDVLDFAKLESGKVHLKASAFAVQDMVECVYQRFAEQARLQGLRLVTEIAPDVPDRLYGDEVRIVQMLNYVVHNAIKFTRNGSVEIHCAYAQQQIRFCINDSGIGIPDDKLGQIFAPFKQGDNSATRHYGGVGLGLAITQKLVRLMGGMLSIHSTFGHGTTVTIELPLRPA